MYIFTFSLLGFFAFDDVFLNRKKYYLLFFSLVIFWLIFHDGFRWGVGTDWNSYHDYFMNCLESNDEGFEIGYRLMNLTVRSLTDNYSVFLVLHALIVYLFISRSIFKYGVNPLLSIFFFYCIMLTYQGMNRQYISFAICIFSYKYIFERKPTAFLLCIAVGFLFHTSAIMFVFAYFLNKEFKTKYLIILFSAIFVISVTGLMNRLPLGLFFLVSESVGDKISFYSESNIFTTNIVFTILALLKRSIWIILAIAYKNHIKNKDEHFNFFFNLYFVGALIYILFNNTILQVVVARGILYYNIGEIFLIPYVLTIFKDDITKKVMFLALVAYGWLTLEKGINSYIEGLGFDIFRPYNSVLIDDKYNVYDK